MNVLRAAIQARGYLAAGITGAVHQPGNKPGGKIHDPGTRCDNNSGNTVPGVTLQSKPAPAADIHASVPGQASVIFNVQLALTVAR